MAVVLATLVAAVLRLTNLGGKSLWLDEAFSVTLARAPWPSFVQQLRTNEANMGLYYAVLRPWLSFGSSESSVRMLSALVGILTIPVVYALGARLFGRRAGIAAAFVLALDPFHLGLSQDARSYPLAIFLVACSTWAFVQIVGGSPTGRAMEGPDVAARQPRRPSGLTMWSVVHVLASASAVYAHFYAAFVLVAQYGSLLRRPSQPPPWRRLAVCAVAIGLLVSPLIVFLLHGQHNNIDWIGGEIAYAFFHFSQVVRTPIGFAAVVYLSVLIVLTGAALRNMQAAPTGPDRWPYLLVLLWLGMPIVVPLAVSVAVKPVFDLRYASIAIPAIALLAGTFVSQASTRRRAIASFTALAALELLGDWVYGTRIQKEDWRRATFTVLSAAAPGDVVAFYAPYVRRPYDYYVGQYDSPATAPLILYPSKGYSTLGTAEAHALSLPDAIAHAAETAPRTWLVLSHARTDSACRRVLDTALRSAYRTMEDRQFEGVEVRLYTDRAAAIDSANRSGPLGPATKAIGRQCPQT